MPPTAKAFARAPLCSPYESDRMPACDGRGQRARAVLTTAAASAEDSAHSTAQVTTNAWHERLQRTQHRHRTTRPPPMGKIRRRGFPGGQIYVATGLNDPARQPEKSSESQQKKSPAGPQVRPSTRAHDFFLPGNATVSSPRPRPLRHPSPTHPPTHPHAPPLRTSAALSPAGGSGTRATAGQSRRVPYPWQPTLGT